MKNDKADSDHDADHAAAAWGKGGGCCNPFQAARRENQKYMAPCRVEKAAA